MKDHLIVTSTVYRFLEGEKTIQCMLCLAGQRTRYLVSNMPEHVGGERVFKPEFDADVRMRIGEVPCIWPDTYERKDGQ